MLKYFDDHLKAKIELS